jgi:hypothetical protein
MRCEGILLVLALMQPPSSGPQSATATLSVSLGSHARLALLSTTLAFPDSDPDTLPRIPSVPAAIGITAKARTTRNSQVTLTVQSTDDLRSGVTLLPAATITWSAAGPGFLPGTLSRSAAQMVGAWTGSGIRSGSQSFFFENRWTHPPGIYTITLVYTMSAP